MVPDHYCPISRSVSKGEDGGHGPEKTAKRLTSLQAMSPATAGRGAAPPPDLMPYNVYEIERL